MNITYIKNLNRSFMIIRDAEYTCENFELLMLLNNRIPGLMEVQIIIGDGKVEYWYDITGMTALDTLLDLYPLDSFRIRRIIEDLFDMNLKIGEFLLDPSNICYLPKTIYMDRSEGRYRFCYLPGCCADGAMGIQALTEYMLTRIDHTDRETVKIGYALYDRSIQECCSLKELMDCCTYIPETEDVKAESVTENSFQQKEKEDIEEAAAGWSVLEGMKKLFQKRKHDPDEEEDESGYEAYICEPFAHKDIKPNCIRENPTVLLHEFEQNVCKLVYQGSGEEEDFILGEDIFLIGKENGNVSAVLKADTVSRMHARITKKDGCYYLEDLNSTNGTYLNGEELIYHDPVKLKKNDRICFATEEYIFC